MAETLGVVASGISVAAFAGQLAQGSAFLYTFFKDIENAPGDIRSLSHELQLMTSILSTIQGSFDTGDAGLEQALNHCEKVINELSAVVQTVVISPDLTKWKTLRKQFATAFKRAERMKHLHSLERAKSMLLQCCTTSIRVAQSAESATVRDIKGSLSDLSRAYATNTAMFLDGHRVITDTQQAVTATQTISDEILVTATDTKTVVVDTKSMIGEISVSTSNLHESVSKIAAVTSETHSQVNSWTSEIQNLRTMTNGTDEYVRRLLARSENSEQDLHKVITNSINQTISNRLRRHLKKRPEKQVDRRQEICFEDRGPTSCSAVGTANNPSVEVHCNYQQRGNTRHLPDHPSDHWVKNSTVSTNKVLVSNRFLGTLTFRSTVISYSRKESEGSTAEKEERRTTISFLPASWLLSKCVLLAYSECKRLGAGVQPSILPSLTTVNIIDSGSEIIRACMELDLATIRTLFDDGKASPYDVDEDGRNLLGWAVLGARFEPDSGTYLFPTVNQHCSGEYSESQNQRVENLSYLIDLLLDYGLDAGNSELHNTTPVMHLSTCWFENHPDDGKSFEDQCRFLLNKLLSRAKTDPFGCDIKALVSVCGREYVSIHFPGTLPNWVIHPAALEVLIGQTEWSLSWDPSQITSMCDIFWDCYYQNPQNIVRYWVTSTCSVIQKDLEARTNFLESFSKPKTSLPGEFPEIGLDQIHELIHSGGNVIALLTEHTYSDGSVPWVRHRVKKLILIREFMIQTLILLLDFSGSHITDPIELDKISIHAQLHNARTVYIWRRALEKASEGARSTRPCCPLENTGRVVQTDASTNDGDHVTAFVEEDDWETEGSDGSQSGWETEEEWEEGHMLDTAVDRDPQDAENKQKRRPAGCTCQGSTRDYDEEYWSHVYPRLSMSQEDEASSKTSESLLKSVAQASASFISNVLRR